MFTDKRGFFPTQESTTKKPWNGIRDGRDDKALKKDLMEQAKDLAKSSPCYQLKTTERRSWGEKLLNSFGVQEQRWDAVQTIGSQVAGSAKHKINSQVDTVTTVKRTNTPILRWQ